MIKTKHWTPLNPVAGAVKKPVLMTWTSYLNHRPLTFSSGQHWDAGWETGSESRFYESWVTSLSHIYQSRRHIDVHNSLVQKPKSRTRIRYRLSTRFDLRNLNYATENEPEGNSNFEEIEEVNEEEENISFVQEVESQSQLREFEEISVESLNVDENTGSQELDRKVTDSWLNREIGSFHIFRFSGSSRVSPKNNEMLAAGTSYTSVHFISRQHYISGRSLHLQKSIMCFGWVRGAIKNGINQFFSVLKNSKPPSN